jgi:HlyD family secretion protein
VVAKDQADLQNAERAVSRARLELLKNEMLSAILAEKNEQTLAEAEANLEMLRRAFDLKRRAERAERRALEIQRDRARNAMEHAQGNIGRMIVKAPQDGLVVLKSVWKGSQMGEVQEGEEVRPGTPLIEVVDPSRMRVRARVNQADVPLLHAGQRASIELDAYPGKRFTGVLERISPAGAISGLNSRVRTFVTTFAIDQSDAALLPDLTAAVDVEVDRREAALVVPRESLVRSSRGTAVHVIDGRRTREQAVTVTAWTDGDAAIASGLAEGTLIVRRPNQEPSR